MKTTSKTFYQIFVLTTYVLSVVTFVIAIPYDDEGYTVVTPSSSTSTCNCSTYDRSYKNILSRKKRFLIFPKGGNIINTSYFGKQVVSGFPTGFNWILELDIFWPLPFEPRVYSQAKDLLFGKNKPKVNVPPWLVEPKKPSYSTYAAFLNVPPTKPTKPMNMPIEIIHDMPPSDHFKWEHDHPGEVFVPSSGWKDDVIENIKNQIDMKHRAWDPYNMSGYNSNYNNWFDDNNNNLMESRNDKQQYYYPRGRSLKYNSKDGIKNSNYIDPNPRWENIYAQKDRQELYDIIHVGFKKIGIDTTTCLQRTICEVKHFLLPQGKSLLHDVFRVFFTYPMHMDDKYGEAARIENENSCSTIYGKDCPVSVLDFFLHSEKVF